MNRKKYIFREEYFGGFLYDTNRLWYDILDISATKEIISGKSNINIEDIDFRMHKLPESKAIFSPIRVYYESTRVCNLGCKTCFNKAGQKREEELSTQEAIRLIDMLRKYDVIDLRFTGGEFTEREDWDKLLMYSIESGLITSLNTNGVLSQSKLEKLIEINPDQITISIDGPKRIHDSIRGQGTFDKTYSSLRWLASNNSRKLRVNAILNSTTLPYIEDTIKLVSGLAPEICFIYMWPLGRGEKMMNTFVNFKQLIQTEKSFPELSQKYNNIRILSTHQGIFRSLINPVKDGLDLSGCAGGFRTLSILASGEVYPCAYLAEMRENKQEYVLGKVNDSDFDLFELWHNSKKLTGFRDQVIERNKTCRSCKLLLNQCMGTCVAMDTYKKYSQNNTNPYCLKEVISYET